MNDVLGMQVGAQMYVGTITRLTFRCREAGRQSHVCEAEAGLSLAFVPPKI